MKKFLSMLLTSLMLFAMASSVVWGASENAKPMYRLYNPNSGEHFYTAAIAERLSLVRAGWHYEGIGWMAPATGKPVYRLYNPNSGDHHYTLNANERDGLVRAGWKYEGVGWNSGGSAAVYRQYNPKAKTGTHNYTTSKAENDSLVRAGWRNEGVGWYGVENSYCRSLEAKYPTYECATGKVSADKGNYYEAAMDIYKDADGEGVFLGSEIVRIRKDAVVIWQGYRSVYSVSLNGYAREHKISGFQNVRYIRIWNTFKKYPVKYDDNGYIIQFYDGIFD